MTRIDTLVQYNPQDKHNHIAGHRKLHKVQQIGLWVLDVLIFSQLDQRINIYLTRLFALHANPHWERHASIPR